MATLSKMCPIFILASSCVESESEDVNGTWTGRCSNSDPYIGFDAQFQMVLEEQVESELTGAGTISVLDLEFQGEIWGVWAPPQLEVWFEGEADKETITLDLIGEVAEDGQSVQGDCTVWGVWGELEMAR